MDKDKQEYGEIWTRESFLGVSGWLSHLTLAQVMISRLVSSSTTLGSALTAQSPEPASDFCVSPTLSQINTKKKKKKKKKLF